MNIKALRSATNWRDNGGKNKRVVGLTKNDFNIPIKLMTEPSYPNLKNRIEHEPLIRSSLFKYEGITGFEH